MSARGSPGGGLLGQPRAIRREGEEGKKREPSAEEHSCFKSAFFS
jgi:hypothetical protein